MKKIIAILKISFKQQMAYRFDVFTGVVFSTTKIVLAMILWGAIFEKADIVAGFTLHTMLAYYIIQSFITQLNQSGSMGWKIANEIKSGKFSKYLVRPMNHFTYFAIQALGNSLFLLIFNLGAAVSWVFIFGVKLDLTNNLLNLLAAILMILLGLIMMIQLDYFIGILAFKFTEIGLFKMISDNLIQFLAGSLIPLTLLPDSILKGLSFLPFYYISYLPSMLLLGRNQDEVLYGLGLLLIWNLLFGIVNHRTFNRLRLKYEGVGL